MGRKKQKNREWDQQICLYVFIELRLNLGEMESIFSFTSFLAKWGNFPHKCFLNI